MQILNSDSNSLFKNLNCLIPIPRRSFIVIIVLVASICFGCTAKVPDPNSQGATLLFHRALVATEQLPGYKFSFRWSVQSSSFAILTDRVLVGEYENLDRSAVTMETGHQTSNVGPSIPPQSYLLDRGRAYNYETKCYMAAAYLGMYNGVIPTLETIGSRLKYVSEHKRAISIAEFSSGIIDLGFGGFQSINSGGHATLGLSSSGSVVSVSATLDLATGGTLRITGTINPERSIQPPNIVFC